MIDHDPFVLSLRNLLDDLSLCFASVCNRRTNEHWKDVRAKYQVLVHLMRPLTFQDTGWIRGSILEFVTRDHGIARRRAHFGQIWKFVCKYFESYSDDVKDMFVAYHCYHEMGDIVDMHQLQFYDEYEDPRTPSPGDMYRWKHGHWIYDADLLQYHHFFIRNQP